MLREWIDCFETKGGLLVALQQRGRQRVAVKQMLDEWLDRYRQLEVPHMEPSSHAIPTHSFSSDGESDQEWLPEPDTCHVFGDTQIYLACVVFVGFWFILLVHDSQGMLCLLDLACF